MKILDLSDQTFGRWTVLERAENTPQGQAQWLCRCECGNERIVKSILLRRGITQSCGCYKLDRSFRDAKHGHAHSGAISPTYWSWAGMIARCTNPKHRAFPLYGGRGVQVYAPWYEFSNFLEDMGEKPQGMSLDRINNNGNYEPSNCHWASDKQQARNKRSNRLLVLNGETHTVAEWAELRNIRAATIRDRLSFGWPTDKALSVPDGTASDNIRSRRITISGETHTLSEWLRHKNIPISTFYYHLHQGEQPDEILVKLESKRPKSHQSRS